MLRSPHSGHVAYHGAQKGADTETTHIPTGIWVACNFCHCFILKAYFLWTGAGAAQPNAACSKGEEAADICSSRGFTFTALDSHDPGILERLQPGYVVMYDPDIAFIRQLEVSGTCIMSGASCFSKLLSVRPQR